MLLTCSIEWETSFGMQVPKARNCPCIWAPCQMCPCWQSVTEVAEPYLCLETVGHQVGGSGYVSITTRILAKGKQLAISQPTALSISKTACCPSVSQLAKVYSAKAFWQLLRECNRGHLVNGRSLIVREVSACRTSKEVRRVT